MESAQKPPRFSIIIPAPTAEPKPGALEDLAAMAHMQPEWEVFVAIGSNPSRQRNLAAAQARGEMLVFLDSDCRTEPGHFERLAAHLTAGRRVIGGPVLLEQPAGPLERLFQRLLAHHLLTGQSSARYRPDGRLRPCSDASLILCNMAVERRLFVESGGFEERLYPNEENEWITRLRAAGVACWYDPECAVRRPQRKTWPAFFRMLTGYGRGRTRQFLVSRKWDLPRQAPGALFLGWLGLFLIRPRFAIKAAVAGWLAVALAACLGRSGERLSPREALAAPLVPLFYALGQLMGFLSVRQMMANGEALVYRWDPASKSLVLSPPFGPER